LSLIFVKAELEAGWTLANCRLIVRDRVISRK
jgi:hypothetical protein